MIKNIQFILTIPIIKYKNKLLKYGINPKKRCLNETKNSLELYCNLNKNRIER